MGEWCRRQSIPFVSLTGPLREAVSNGKQVYLTYDQHWTPVGHEVVAQAVHRYLAERSAALEPDPSNR